MASGGQVDDWIAVSGLPLPVAEALGWAVTPACGAVVTFAGTVRDHAPGRPEVTLLEYEAYEPLARRVFELGIPVVIVVNKIDRLKAGHIATQMKEAATLGDFHALHPVSAVTGDGIDELRSDLISLLPEGPMYYPAETDTDMSVEARIAELVREQALRLLKEELPHAITAEVVEIEEKHVHVRLYTETESQKQILIGKGGSMVREIGRTARPFVEQLLGHPVYLQLQVKASPKWRRNQTMLERVGL